MKGRIIIVLLFVIALLTTIFQIVNIQGNKVKDILSEQEQTINKKTDELEKTMKIKDEYFKDIKEDKVELIKTEEKHKSEPHRIFNGKVFFTTYEDKLYYDIIFNYKGKEYTEQVNPSQIKNRENKNEKPYVTFKYLEKDITKYDVTVYSGFYGIEVYE